MGNAFPTFTGEMAAIDRDGRRHEFIYGYRAGEKQTGTRLGVRESTYADASLISTLEDDPDEILIAEYPWKVLGNTIYSDPDAKPVISRLNVYNGRKRRIDTAPLAAARLLADQNDDVRFAVGYDANSRLAVSWKRTPDAPWEIFELPGFRDESVEPHHFTGDNRSVLFTGVREGESLHALYRLDLQTQTVEKVFGHESVDVEGIITDLHDDAVIGVRVHTDKPEHHWIAPDDPMARAYRMLERAFPGQTVSIASITRDGKTAIVFVRSDVNPGEYYLFDVEKRHAVFAHAARAWIDPRQMRPKEPIRLTARDGLPLHGYITRPAGKGPHPMIVLPHGGPHGVRDRWASDPEVQLFANRGYAVLQINYRGSGGYGMDFEAAGYLEWGGKIQDDITDATRWAIEQGIADADLICILGWSFGGYSALMSVVREPKLYRCAVGLAGVYDLPLMYSSGDVRRSRIGRRYLSEVIGRDEQQLRAYSPAHNARHIEVPVLLVHGKEDWRADYAHAKSMRAALDAAGRTCEWIALGREGHGICEEDTRLEVYERVLTFLEKHLAPPVVSRDP